MIRNVDDTDERSKRLIAVVLNWQLCFGEWQRL
jgi:hypothetical protein